MKRRRSCWKREGGGGAGGAGGNPVGGENTEGEVRGKGLGGF